MLARQHAAIGKPDLICRGIGVESSRLLSEAGGDGEGPVRQLSSVERLEELPQGNRAAVLGGECAPPGSGQGMNEGPGSGKPVGLRDARGVRLPKDPAVPECLRTCVGLALGLGQTPRKQ